MMSNSSTSGHSGAVGCYPEVVASAFTEAEDLSRVVDDECNRRSIDWQKVSKDTIKMRDEAEPDYSFPDDLKLTESPMLGASKIAYKNLVSGFANKTTLSDLLTLEQCNLISHRRPSFHPLRQHGFSDIISQWTTNESSPPPSPVTSSS